MSSLTKGLFFRVLDSKALREDVVLQPGGREVSVPVAAEILLYLCNKCNRKKPALGFLQNAPVVEKCECTNAGEKTFCMTYLRTSWNVCLHWTNDGVFANHEFKNFWDINEDDFWVKWCPDSDKRELLFRELVSLFENYPYQ